MQLADLPTAERCCAHPPAEHDPDEGCLHGWTETVKGCPCRPAPKAPTEPAGVFGRITVQMAAAGADGFRVRRVSGQHDRRWRRNR
jgi:hypothetical protein